MSIPGMTGMPGMHQSETNLFSILVNMAFGFVAGLMVFLGPKEVLEYGSVLATEVIKATGYGSQLAQFGITTAAPYVVLAPLGGLVVKELSSVRSVKGFLYFGAAVFAGFAIAFIAQGYFATLISPHVLK